MNQEDGHSTFDGPSPDWMAELTSVAEEVSEFTRFSSDEILSQAYEQLLPQLKIGEGGLFRSYASREQAQDSDGHDTQADPFRSYLRAVARTAHLRLCMDDKKLHCIDPFKLNEALDHHHMIELDHVGQRLHEELMLAALKSLPAHTRKLLRDRYFNELSCEEIARQLNITVEAVHTRLYRARVVLKKLTHMMIEHHFHSHESSPLHE